MVNNTRTIATEGKGNRRGERTFSGQVNLETVGNRTKCELVGVIRFTDPRHMKSRILLGAALLVAVVGVLLAPALQFQSSGVVRKITTQGSELRPPSQNWNRFVQHSFSGRPARILMPLPDEGFDPTEAAVPWKTLVARGHTVVAATESGVPPAADAHVLRGFVGGLVMKIFPEPFMFYNGTSLLQHEGCCGRSRRDEGLCL